MRYAVCTEDGLHIADVTSYGADTATAKANAQLIASAPLLLSQRNALLEALKGLLHEFEILTDNDPDYAPIADQARLAISQAQEGI